LTDQELKIITEQMNCCPVDNTIKIIGKKFTIHILRNMTMMGQARFSQFLESVEGINPKTLAVRLKEMEKSGLISRRVYPETPIRIEYTISEKGKALKPIIEQMAAFSMKYCCDTIFKDGKPRTFKEVFGKQIKILS